MREAKILNIKYEIIFYILFYIVIIFRKIVNGSKLFF